MLNFIILSRLNGGIGDYLCFTGVIKLINEQYPSKKIIILSGNKEVFKNNNRISLLVNVNSQWLKRLFRLSIRILSSMKIPAYNFLYGNKGSGMEAFIKENPHLHYTKVLSNHIRLNLDYSKIKNEIFFSNEEVVNLSEKLRLPEDFCLIHSTSKKSHTPNKEVGSNAMQNIVDSNKELQFLQIGLLSDKKLDNCIDYRGKTENLRELFYVISKAKLCVSMEGGYNHIANAFAVPSFVIYTGFNSINLCQYDNTTGIQNEKLPDCSPCMLLEECPNGMICNYYDIVGSVNEKIRRWKKDDESFNSK